MKPNSNLKSIINEIVSHAQTGRWGVVTTGLHTIFEAAPPPPPPADDKKDSDTTPDAGTPPPPPPPDGDVPPAGDTGDAPAPTPSGGEDKTPAPEEKPEDAAEKASEKASEASKEADKAKEEAEKAKETAEKAKAEMGQAEQEIEQASYIKLNSKSGLTFLLNNLLGDALIRNKIDGIAKQFIDKLKITSPEDLQNFQRDTTVFRSIKGYNQLLQAMSTMVAKPAQEEKPQPTVK